MTESKQETKERILSKGAELVHSRGFNNTGLKDILQASGVPKGSFYFYFENKEAFGLELIDHHMRFFSEHVTPILNREDIPPTQRILGFFAWFKRFFTEHGFAMGCPIGNLCQEMSDLSPAFRDRLSRAMEAIIRPVSKLLSQAREQGELDPGHDPEELACFLVASWQGAMLLMKVEKSARPLEIFEAQARQLLSHPNPGPRQ